MIKKRLLFVVNPISGRKKKEKFIASLPSTFPNDKYIIQVQFSQYPGHAKFLANKAKELGFDAVIACGGDGTINEVASVLSGSNTALGIIPFGSGNGFARHIGIPMKAFKAAEVIKNWVVQPVDTGLINKVPFFNMTGLGFDAHIGRKFAQYGKRGFWSYFKITLREYWRYKEKNILVSIDKQKHQHKAMMLTVANSSQFGNNARIAPLASLTDGHFELCIVRKFPLYASITVAYLMFTGKIHRSRYISIIRAQKIKIEHKRKWVHVDGEPIKLGKKLRIKLQPLNLNVLIGRTKI